MPLVPTEEQEMLRKTAREFVTENTPVKHLRALRDSKDPVGYSPEIWKQMSELGWTGITLPEEYGGSGLGYAELGVILEECGRTLTPEPLLASVVLAAEAVALGGSEEQKRELLPLVCSGDQGLALAFQESGRFHPYRVTTSATPTDGGYRISGSKQFVLNGHMAGRLIVVARTSGAEFERGGLSLFLVDPAAEGVEVTRTSMVDGRNSARVVLSGVEVPGGSLLGAIDDGAAILDPVFDRATAAVCAEMLGSASEAFERTLEYLKTREQFGTRIGTFQALKHRAALMFCELELSRSIVAEVLSAIDEEREELPTLVCTAKARLSDTAALVSCEAIQMHGGIGMTDEEEIGFFLKRARTAELFLGDAHYHRDRFAELQGF
ncbi:MAG: acyl-CoA dehydrogenase family protein [Deltaproteobacteria bacterium]|nr:acyl-CoA dehydrogenase family protein [Deltaproteobacteria bacterium]